jgi:uncharacterized protein
MTDLQLIDAVKTGDHSMIKDLIESGTDLNQQDEQGWTPLNWAAGKGDSASVKLLLDKSADPFKVGRDQRTPYKIALAAGHIEVVNLLREAESRVDGGKSSRSDRKYVKAYCLDQLRKFSGWHEEKINKENENGDPAANGDRALSDDDVVYLHEDLTVTQSMWPNEQIIFNRTTSEWEDFCTNVLQFRVPDDTEFCVSAQSANKEESS